MENGYPIFSDKETEEFFITGNIGKWIGWSNITRMAKRKLDMIHYAAQLGDLRAPQIGEPGVWSYLMN